MAQVLSDILKLKSKFSISRHGPCAKHKNWQAHKMYLYCLDIFTASLIWSNGENWAISHFYVLPQILLAASINIVCTAFCLKADTEW